MTPWTVACEVLCPWDFSGKNIEVGCHALLQGIFPKQGSNLHLLHCRQILYHWATGDLTYLNYIHKDPISKGGHIHRYQGLDFKATFGKDIIQPIIGSGLLKRLVAEKARSQVREAGMREGGRDERKLKNSVTRNIKKHEANISMQDWSKSQKLQQNQLM